MFTSNHFQDIIMRLALADRQIIPGLLASARENAGELLPGDIEMLEGWAGMVEILRGALARCARPDDSAKP